MFKLGDLLKDRITGFKGVATARVEFLNGCVRFCLTPEKLNKDSKPAEGEYFDVQQIELVKASRLVTNARVATTGVGGPFPAPSRGVGAPRR